MKEDEIRCQSVHQNIFRFFCDYRLQGTSKNLTRVKRRHFSFLARRDEMSNSNAIALFIQRSQVRKGQI